MNIIRLKCSTLTSSWYRFAGVFFFEDSSASSTSTLTSLCTLTLVCSTCCDRKSRAACAQSFAPWQQATTQITRRDHSIIACSRHVHNGVILHAHPVRGESHNQRNTTADVATQWKVIWKWPTFQSCQFCHNLAYSRKSHCRKLTINESIKPQWPTKKRFTESQALGWRIMFPLVTKRKQNSDFYLTCYFLFWPLCSHLTYLHHKLLARTHWCHHTLCFQK